jgi:glycolate oxidase iron-sulfur subunit
VTASAFSGPDAPRLEDIRKCVHCGICLPQCPTYRVLGEEMDSPRGRIYLMRAASEGRIGVTDALTRHLDLCLGCRACETACPSGVPFGELLEAARGQIHRQGRGTQRGAFASFVYRVLPNPRRLGALLMPLRLYQRSGLRSVVRASRLLRVSPRLAAMEAMLPDVPAQVPLPEVTLARGTRRGRVGLLTGCVQRHLFPHVNRDTVKLLSLAGYDVVVPRAQGCCGALDLHAGRIDEFRTQATALCGAFSADLDFVVTNAAGCGSAMKEYGHWVRDARTKDFADRVRDVSEVLAKVELPLTRIEATVTYHDACHLAHGQRVRGEPRELLRRIPGLTLVELPESDLCCGSAGVYNLFEPDMADRLLERKVARVVETGARIVATGNPGCLLQITKGLRARGVTVEVVHPIELLARSAREANGNASSGRSAREGNGSASSARSAREGNGNAS